MKRILLVIIAFFSLNTIPSLLFAQTKIHGVVTDINSRPLNGVTILLLKADSALVKGTVSNNSGNYFFENITTGDYFISFSHTGFSPQYSSLFKVFPGLKNTDIDTLKLEQITASLTNVTVTAKRPLYEQNPDRLTINVENSIAAAGSTALQILERSPGVVVNRQSNTIAMLGKEGVRIMINGKLSYLPASAILQMLDGMNAGSIDKIELISTPPANFDAEGNAGYINIVLKQNDNSGTNGSFYVTPGYGKGWVTQAGINFNHRNGKVNVFGDYSYSRVKSPFPGSGYNRISNNGDIYETYNKINRTDTTRTHNARLGLDYQLTNRLIAGILFTSDGRWYRQAELTTAAFNLNGLPDTMSVNSNRELNNWQNYGININLQQRLEKDGNLSFNASYLHYKNNQPFNYYSKYYDKTNVFVYDETNRNGKQTPLIFWLATLDYSQKLSKKINIQTGIKGTIASFTNKLNFERLIQGNWMEDTLLSSTFVLKENYSAAYASIEIAADEKTTLKGGLRYEYTNSNLGTTQTKNIIDRHYGKLFPTLFLSHKLNEKSAISLSYGSRITRPSFEDLAPFTYYSNRNSLLTGNPALQPAIAYAVSAGYTFKKYFFQLSFTKEDNKISFFQPDVDSASKKIINKPENLRNQKLVALTFSVPVKIATWWSMQYNITATYQQVNAWYKKEPVQIEQKNISLNMTQSFTLPEHFSIELSGFYNSRNLNGLTVFKPIGSLDFGIRKKLGARDNINFSVSNLLNSMDLRGYTDLPEKNMVGDIHIRFSWRTYKLTYTRSFGKEKLKASRSRTTGAEDEKGRVNLN
jgi:Outer membrane protein beta-barrel family/Carboxypeptidase regulatory-like domain